MLQLSTSDVGLGEVSSSLLPISETQSLPICSPCVKYNSFLGLFSFPIGSNMSSSVLVLVVLIAIFNNQYNKNDVASVELLLNFYHFLQLNNVFFPFFSFSFFFCFLFPFLCSFSSLSPFCFLVFFSFQLGVPKRSKHVR